MGEAGSAGSSFLFLEKPIYGLSSKGEDGDWPGFIASVCRETEEGFE